MKNIKLLLLLVALGSMPSFMNAEEEAPAEEEDDKKKDES